MGILRDSPARELYLKIPKSTHCSAFLLRSIFKKKKANKPRERRSIQGCEPVCTIGTRIISVGKRGESASRAFHMRVSEMMFGIKAGLPLALGDMIN